MANQGNAVSELPAPVRPPPVQQKPANRQLSCGRQQPSELSGGAGAALLAEGLNCDGVRLGQRSNWGMSCNSGGRLFFPLLCRGEGKQKSIVPDSGQWTTEHMRIEPGPCRIRMSRKLPSRGEFLIIQKSRIKENPTLESSMTQDRL